MTQFLFFFLLKFFQKIRNFLILKLVFKLNGTFFVTMTSSLDNFWKFLSGHTLFSSLKFCSSEPGCSRVTSKCSLSIGHHYGAQITITSISSVVMETRSALTERQDSLAACQVLLMLLVHSEHVPSSLRGTTHS